MPGPGAPFLSYARDHPPSHIPSPDAQSGAEGSCSLSESAAGVWQTSASSLRESRGPRASLTRAGRPTGRDGRLPEPAATPGTLLALAVSGGPCAPAARTPSPAGGELEFGGSATRGGAAGDLGLASGGGGQGRSSGPGFSREGRRRFLNCPWTHARALCTR